MPEEATEGAEAQPAPSTSSGGGGGSTVGGSTASGSGRRKRRLPEGGSPMDVCPTPFTGRHAARHWGPASCCIPGSLHCAAALCDACGSATYDAAPRPACGTPLTRLPSTLLPVSEDGARISEHTPFFPPDSPTAYAPIDAVVAWLADTLRPTDDGAGERWWCTLHQRVAGLHQPEGCNAKGAVQQAP